MHTGCYLHQTYYWEDDNNVLHPRRSVVLLCQSLQSESVPVKRLVEEDGDYAVAVLQKEANRVVTFRGPRFSTIKRALKSKIEVAEGSFHGIGCLPYCRGLSCKFDLTPAALLWRHRDAGPRHTDVCSTIIFLHGRKLNSSVLRYLMWLGRWCQRHS